MGALVLADISGYTTFVNDSELEHSQNAVAALLEAVIASFAGRLEACQVEGDAIFFVGEGLDPRFLSWIEDAYVAFHRTARQMGARGCPCRACALITSLSLKAIAHYGRCSKLHVGPSAQVHGSDVIVPHRLSKNSVPSRDYVLVTQAVAERLPEADRARLLWRDEDAGEFGTMRIGYLELAPLRARADA